MMSSPSLSIIIPTFNEQNYLPNLLKDLSNQSFQDFEVIIADNKSTDKTPAIAKKAGARVVLGGLPGAGRNAGAKVAKASRLLFLDSDVRLDPDFLERSLLELNRRKINLATCKSSPQSNKMIDKIIFGIWDVFVIVTQLFSPHAAGYCIFSTKKIHTAIEGFDESILLAEDIDYVFRAAKYRPQQKFRILNTYVYTSSRRFDKQGRVKLGIKLVISEIYRGIYGEIKDNRFSYDFKGYDKKNTSYSR